MRAMLVMGLALAAGPAFAGTPCEAVKAKIEAKLEKKGVKNYTLEVVDAKEEKAGRVVGQCDGGKKKIVYARSKN